MYKFIWEEGGGSSWLTSYLIKCYRYNQRDWKWMLWVYFRNLIVSLSQLSHLLYTKSVFEKVFLFVTECPENCTTFTLLSRLFIEFHCLLFCIYRTPSRCWVATPAPPPCTRRRTRSVWGPTPSRHPWNTPTWTTTTVDSWNLPANGAKIWQWNVLVCNLTQMRRGDQMKAITYISTYSQSSGKKKYMLEVISYLVYYQHVLNSCTY